MDVTKPYEFIGLGAMDVTKPYEFIGFGAMDVTKPTGACQNNIEIMSNLTAAKHISVEWARISVATAPGSLTPFVIHHIKGPLS